LPRAGYRLGMDLNVVAGERFDLQLGHRIGGGNLTHTRESNLTGHWRF